MHTLRAIARTKMFTPGFKLFAGLAGFAFAAAYFFGVSSNGKILRQNLIDSFIGPLSLGWKGDVGNHVGYVFFVSVAAGAGLIGGLLVAFRDADPEAGAEYVHADSVPLTRAPYGTSYWPMAAAFAVGAVILGLVTDMAIFWTGVVALVAVTGVWAFRSWAERATGDDETNLAIYNRFINPIRIPVTALLVIGIVVIDLSRINLTMPSGTSSIIVFGVAGAVMFGFFVLLSYLPELRKTALAAIVVAFAALFIVAGVIGASRGSRGFGGHEKPGGEAPVGEPKSTHADGVLR